MEHITHDPSVEKAPEYDPPTAIASLAELRAEEQHLLMHLRIEALRKLRDLLAEPQVRDINHHREQQLVRQICLALLRLRTASAKELTPAPPDGPARRRLEERNERIRKQAARDLERYGLPWLEKQLQQTIPPATKEVDATPATAQDIRANPPAEHGDDDPKPQAMQRQFKKRRRQSRGGKSKRGNRARGLSRAPP